MKGTFEDRFWSRVDIRGPEDCWEWQKGRNHDGYGSVRDSRRNRARTAHRVAYELAHGYIPLGQSVLHRCDNRPCVNPAHLYLGTQLENNRDRSRRNRNNHPFGEANHASKLTADQVIEIRAACASGETQASLAARYGIAPATLSAIVTGRIWKHLPLDSGRRETLPSGRKAVVWAAAK